MRTLVLRSGIHPKTYDSIINRADNIKDDEELIFFHDSLQDVLTTQWRDAWDIWKLPSISNPDKADEVWERYDALGLTGNPEQVMLAEKLLPLNQAFRELIKCLPKSVSQKSKKQQEKIS